MRGFETIIEKRRDSILRNSLLSDEFINFVQKNKRPFDEMMSYYKCAIMEVETKFRVLNEQYSLEYDRKPIEDIKSRTKSMESLMLQDPSQKHPTDSSLLLRRISTTLPVSA